jgi:hypothetical protein
MTLEMLAEQLNFFKVKLLDTADFFFVGAGSL